MSALLSLAQEVATVLGLQQPQALFGAYNEGDLSDRKITRALTQTARKLGDDFDWQIIKARHTFTSLAAETQTAKLPTDMRRMIDGTFWDVSLAREVCGPLSDEEYATAKGSPVGRIDPAWKIDGGELLLIPAPPAGRTYAFGYIRDSIGRNAAAARISSYSADTDVPYWDDELMILGAVYHYRKAERYDYAQDELDWKLCMQDRVKRDGGGKILRMGGGRATRVEAMKKTDVRFAT